MNYKFDYTILMFKTIRRISLMFRFACFFHFFSLITSTIDIVLLQIIKVEYNITMVISPPKGNQGQAHVISMTHLS